MQQYNVNKQEQEDFELLKKFNEEIFKLKDLGRRSGNTNPIDASGLTEDNNVINMELKKRDCAINTYPSLMIETHKAFTLLDEYIKYSRIPLYVNFLNDNTVAVFNLIKTDGYMKREATKSRLYNDSVEYQYKEYLPLQQAWIYKRKNGMYQLVQKGS